MIKESIYGPIFYRELLAQPFRLSWKYYSALALLAAVLLTIISSVPLVAGANKVVHEFPQKFFAYYPDDLEVRVTNGVVSTNQVEPYTLPIPPNLREVAAKDGITTLAIINTTSPFSLEEFNATHALLWIGKEQFAYRDNENSVRLESFTPDMTGVVTEGVLRDIEKHIAPYYRFIGPLIVVLIFIGILVALGINFVYLLFGALLILVLLRIMGTVVAYKKAYQIGLHAITLPLLLQVLFSTTPFSFSGLPYVTSILMLIVVYINYRNAIVAPIEIEAGVDTVAPDAGPAQQS